MNNKKQEGLTAPWWKEKKQQLLEIASKKKAAYVYNRTTLQNYADSVKNIEAVDRQLYAIKANNHPKVLETFRVEGLGFECVSIEEVKRVLELFPDIDRDKILFTPNFAPKEEYTEALDLGIHLTLDNIYPLRHWPQIFQDQKVFLRIDPGHGDGHHEHVKTGGIHSKFGIPRFEIPEVNELIEKFNVSVTGLHAHLGSGIKDSHTWKKTAVILHEVAEALGGVKVLDLGGGFGIRENEEQDSLNLEEVNRSLKEFKENHPSYELWIEPGRFLVAASGVLLATVTQLKGKGEVRYVGINTGMNSFIRPAIYGARHEIVNLSKLDQPATQRVNIVGPICESGDKLGVDRLLPESEEGDVILIENTGAYGHVMSSNYNLRKPAEEVFLE